MGQASASAASTGAIDTAGNLTVGGSNLTTTILIGLALILAAIVILKRK